MNLHKLQNYTFESKTANMADRDVMLYALALGACKNSIDLCELPYVYEEQLRVLPSMSAVLLQPSPWLSSSELGFNYPKILHGEQRARFNLPLAVSDELRGEYTVTGVADKGEGKGALVHFEKKLFDNATDSLLSTVTQVLFMRGDGGCGSYGATLEPLVAVPDTRPDCIDEVPIDPRAALYYRLNGDRNPIHADPESAKRAGFERPILHGLCTYGICGLSLLRTAFDYREDTMGSLNVRFSAPVFPGETLVVESWNTASGVAFQARAKERDVLVLSHGLAEYRDSLAT